MENWLLGGVFLACVYFLTSKKFERIKEWQKIKDTIFVIFLINVYFYMALNLMEPRDLLIKNPLVIKLLTSFGVGLIFVLAVFYLWKFGKELLELKQFTTLAWLLSFIVLAFAYIYFIIYHYNNGAFMYVKNDKWYEIAFDFLYYSFCRGLTFGGGTIEPMTSVAKLFSMIQTVIFYFIIGKSLTIYRNNK